MSETGNRILSGFHYLKNVLDFNTSITDGDRVVVYVPTKVYAKLNWELSQVQRQPSTSGDSFVREMILHDLFIIRPEQELNYLERIVKEIRRLVA